MKRTAFFISDSTGITAEVVGESLLSHFPGIQFEKRALSYVDSTEKANQAKALIAEAATADGAKPIVFETIISDELQQIVRSSNAFCVDVLSTFLKPLEGELGAHSSDEVGRPKVATENARYNRRIDAVQFALENDDGGRINRYNEADIILVGVSRSGKTPTSLYLAMQFGIFPANYPITEDDMESFSLPRPIKEFKDKLFGLTIAPDRLAAIRQERLANSRYASMRQCEQEVREVERMFERFDVPYLDTTDVSIEEISGRILSSTGIERRFK